MLAAVLSAVAGSLTSWLWCHVASELLKNGRLPLICFSMSVCTLCCFTNATATARVKCMKGRRTAVNCQPGVCHHSCKFKALQDVKMLNLARMYENI